MNNLEMANRVITKATENFVEAVEAEEWSKADAWAAFVFGVGSGSLPVDEGQGHGG